MSALPFVLMLCLAAAPVPASAATTPLSAAPLDAPNVSEAPETPEEPETPEVPAVAETVVVTATRSERAVSTLPVSVAVVDGESIEMSPVRSVDDLLREIPGVTPSLVSSSGSTPNNQRFSMRGLGGVRALVLLDGIPLHDPYGGLVQWQNVPLQSLRQIEVVRGGNASLFGNYALGGTVNLLSAPIEANDVAVDLSYGSWDTPAGSVTVDAVINPMLAVRLSHHQLDSDGYYRVPEPSAVDIPAWVEDAVTTARAELRFSDRGNGFLNYTTNDHDVSQGRPLAIIEREIDGVSGGYNQAVGATGLIAARAYTQDQTEHLVNSRIVGSGSSATEYKTQDGITDSSARGASLSWTMQSQGRFPLFSAGVDLMRQEALEHRSSFSRSGAVTEQAEVRGQQTFAGFYAQLSWQPVAGLEVLGSGRFDTYRNENGSQAIVGGPTTAYPESSSNEFDPRISVRYALGGRSAVRGSIYRAFNAPTLRDLYRTTESGTSIIRGNPALEPETLLGGEVGWEWADGARRFEVNLYRSTIDDAQARVALDGSSTLYQFQNLGSIRSQGVELTADVRLSRRWMLRGGYTFADSVIASDPDPELVDNWTPEVPRHAGSIALRFVGERGTRGEIRARAQGDSYGDLENLAVQPAHQVVDVSFSQTLRVGLDIYVQAENVFDEVYYVALTPTALRSGLPRTITGGVRLDSSLWGSKK